MDIIRKRIGLLGTIMLFLFSVSLALANPAQAAEAVTKSESAPALLTQFNDVPSTEANAIYISYLAKKGIIKGFPDGTFQPQEGLTRAQAAVVLVKAAGLENTPVKQLRFPDVKADHWAAASIESAAKAGYISGFPDGTYKPEDKLTRAQGIALIMRLSTQKDRVPLPALKDMDQSHWAAKEMAVALAAEMIGLSEDGKQVYPDAVMKRGSLARALGTLLTKDPGLYTISLEGTIKDVKGDIKLIRKGTTSPLQNDSSILLGDTIKTGSNASASIFYPDGSSVLIKENTEINIKESMGRAYIKNDGSSGTAVENVDIDLKKGTVFGALATKHESTEKQSARINSPLLASLDSKQFIADQDQAPWFQTAQTKKVKMKVDMPWGVAAVRGTFILVSVNPNGTCNVSCLTGSAEVSGRSGNTVPLGGGTSSGIVQGGTAGPAAQMSTQDKQAFGNVQDWVINAALQMDINKEVTAPPIVEMILEIPDQPVPEPKQAEQVKNTLDVVLNALQSSGIQLTEQVKNDLKQQLQNLQQEQSKAVQEAIDNNKGTQQQNQTNSNQGGVGSSSVSYINYASPGTYGPATPEARETIAKNVILGSRDIILRNTIITGDLTLGAGIGDGSVTLKNVKVQGNTNILGGGPNSVTIEDCELYTVTVDNKTNTVRIVAKGSSTVGALTLNSGAKLEESGLSGAGFSSVNTGPSIPAGATIIISGSFASVNINAPGLNIEVAGGSSIEQINLGTAAGGTSLTLALGASVKTLQVNAVAHVKGDGNIQTANINVSGVKIDNPPANTKVSDGIVADVGGKEVSGSSGGNEQPTNTPPTTPEITIEPGSGIVTINDIVKITAFSTDAEKDAITYEWTGRLNESSVYSSGKHNVSVIAVDEHGLRSESKAIVFFVLDSTGKNGALKLESSKSKIIYENDINGAVITKYTFNVPSVSGHSSPNDYAWVKGFNINTQQWDQLDYAKTLNGQYFGRTIYSGSYSKLEFYYYTDHKCMYKESNISYTVEFSVDEGRAKIIPTAGSTVDQTNLTISGLKGAKLWLNPSAGTGGSVPVVNTTRVAGTYSMDITASGDHTLGTGVFKVVEVDNADKIIGFGTVTVTASEVAAAPGTKLSATITPAVSGTPGRTNLTISGLTGTKLWLNPKAGAGGSYSVVNLARVNGTYSRDITATGDYILKDDTLGAGTLGAGTFNVVEVDGSNKVTGFGTVTVRASDVTVVPNNAPTVANPITDQTATVGDGDVTINTRYTFADADYDPLTITAVSSDPGKATVKVIDDSLYYQGLSYVVVSPVAAGTTTITVTANDGDEVTVDEKFDVVVSGGPVAASGLTVSLTEATVGCSVYISITAAADVSHAVYFRVVASEPTALNVGTDLSTTIASPPWTLAPTTQEVPASNGQFVEAVEVEKVNYLLTKWGKSVVPY